jgi:hypothetical protein
MTGWESRLEERGAAQSFLPATGGSAQRANEHCGLDGSCDWRSVELSMDS